MKKRFAAFLAAALMGTMILSGCGSSKEETKAAETTAETATETKVDETKAAEGTTGGVTMTAEKLRSAQLKQPLQMLIRNMRCAGHSQAR